MISLAFGIAAMLLYVCAAVLIFRGLQGGKGAVNSRLAAALAVGCHLASLMPGLWVGSGLNMSFGNALSLIALTIALLVLLGSLIRPLDALGLGVYPIAAVSLLLQLVLPGEHILVGSDWSVQLHIALSVLAFSVLAMACIHALILLFQQRRLHQHRPAGAVSRLPPLSTMESLLFQVLGVGFALLTLALATGVMFVENLFAQHLVHKTVLAFVAWGVFGVLLWGRWRYGWRGKGALRWLITGMLLLLLAYFGSKFVMELLLQR